MVSGTNIGTVRRGRVPLCVNEPNLCLKPAREVIALRPRYARRVPHDGAD
jgi:hypothetical protein